MQTPEENECLKLNSYLSLLRKSQPFTYTFSANGGKRHITVAAKLKRMGLRAGVWDYYFRRKGLPTHWIEMKFGRNTLTDEQKAWRAELEAMGDTFSVCYTSEEVLEDLTVRGFIDPGYVAIGEKVTYIKLKPTGA